ncbi:hypothetical protein [Micromonospora sp. NPDC005806]|uniref:hypothetical protein n=1 Tax=Micromonospora sp. NPDC005806 TaxID=3364234 RepID=UPI003682CA28
MRGGEAGTIATVGGRAGDGRRAGAAERNVVMADYTAYDLDSMAADWNPTKDDWGLIRDVAYASWWQEANNDAMVSRDDLRYAASPPGTGPWQRADCVRARYGKPSARPVGERLPELRGTCVVTSPRPAATRCWW